MRGFSRRDPSKIVQTDEVIVHRREIALRLLVCRSAKEGFSYEDRPEYRTVSQPLPQQAIAPEDAYVLRAALDLFAKWLRENKQIEEVEAIREITISEYILNLQELGKYGVCINARSKKRINYPEHSRCFSLPQSYKQRSCLLYGSIKPF